jgi:NTP pyrophosphatase (non-canonical NTP hydrolase)
MTQYADLRTANVVRQAEWDTGGNMTLSYNGNELAGEVGELIDAALAALDEGDQTNLTALRHEIADVIICCDLLALRLDLQLFTELEIENDYKSESLTKARLLLLATKLGSICNMVKKLERESFGMVGSTGSVDVLGRLLNEMVWQVYTIGADFDLVGRTCVAEKFNLTSRKYGLQTEMVV